MEEQEHNLPPGWVSDSLENVIQPRSEKVSPSDYPESVFIGMDHVESQTTRIIASIPASQMKSSAARFRAGDVLYGRLRPYLNKVAEPSFDGLASAEFIVFPDTPLIRSPFLKHRLNAADFVSFATHLNEGDRPRVSFEQIGDFTLLVPPPQEQIRIVAKIEDLFSELDKGVENLKTAREQLKAYRQAVLKHAFEGRLTEDWRQRRSTPRWIDTTLGQQLSFLTSGSRGWAKFYSDRGEKFIRAQNLKHDRLDLRDIAFVDLPNQSEGMRTRVCVGDLLITITGANVTKTAFVKADIGTAYVSQHVALARPIKGSNPEFLYWYLVAEAAGRKQLNTAAYGAGKPGLNLDNIRSVRLSLPSPEEQAEIVARINAKLSLEENLRTNLDAEILKSQALRQSILRDAFAGKLVAQDPNDESVSVLLERTRTDKARQDKSNNNNKRKRKDAA